VARASAAGFQIEREDRIASTRAHSSPAISHILGIAGRS
jgi:hypothetical protein